MFATVLFMASSAFTAGPVLPDPYVATAPGWMLCMEPDETGLTCSNLSSFEKLGEGRYRSHTVSSWTGTDYIVEYDQDIAIVGGKDCSPLKATSYQNLRFRRGERYLAGRELAEADSRYRRELASAGSLLGCASISGDANNLTVRVEVSGEPKPGYYVILRSLEYPLKWVHVDDGYKIRTWSALKS
jgi:hypothetical protein